MRCVHPKESTYSGKQLIPTGTTARTCGTGGINPIAEGRISGHEVPKASTAFVPAQYFWRRAAMSTGVGNCQRAQLPACIRPSYRSEKDSVAKEERQQGAL